MAYLLNQQTAMTRSMPAPEPFGTRASNISERSVDANLLPEERLLYDFPYFNRAEGHAQKFKSPRAFLLRGVGQRVKKVRFKKETQKSRCKSTRWCWIPYEM